MPDVVCSVLGNLTPGSHSGESSGENVAFTARRENQEDRQPAKSPIKSENTNHFYVNSAWGLNYNPTRLEDKTPGINNSTFSGISTQGILGSVSSKVPPCSAEHQGRKVSATLDSKR